MTSDDPLTAEVVRLRTTTELTWDEIKDKTGLSYNAVRGRYRRWQERRDLRALRGQEPECTIEGVTASEQGPDEDDAYQRALAEWEKRRRLAKRRQNQSISFTHGPAALIFVGDHHFGGPGVDYPRAFAEAELMASIPGARIVIMGDVFDNFILAQMRRIRLGTRLNIGDEWAVGRRYLRIIAPRLAAVVEGNHDFWTELVCGLDYFRDVVDALAPGVIYAQDDALVTLRVGRAEWPGRLRHHWKGASIYNPTHGIERAAKWDQNFLWAVGAHTHNCGVCRGFNVGGRSGMAAMCGSYKRDDDYARREGFPLHNNSTAVSVIFDEDTRSMTGVEDLEMLSYIMRAIYA